MAQDVISWYIPWIFEKNLPLLSEVLYKWRLDFIDWIVFILCSWWFSDIWPIVKKMSVKFSIVEIPILPWNHLI